MSRCMFLHVSLFGQSPEAEEITFNFPSLQVSGRSACFFTKGQPGPGRGSKSCFVHSPISSLPTVCNTENVYFHFSLIFSPAVLNYFIRAYFPLKLLIVYSEYNLVVCKINYGWKRSTLNHMT